MSRVKIDEYKDFVLEIKSKVKEHQYRALKAVNKELISFYWDLGKAIVEKQEQHGWGKSIVEQLSADLRNAFPGIRGFSTRNLWNMRNFSAAYQNKPILQTLSAEIGWSHNICILEKTKLDEERKFYMQMTAQYGWSYNVLVHQIENQSYQKYLNNQTNFDNTLPDKYKDQAKLAVKDEYNFEFLGLDEDYKEQDLEYRIIKNISNFLQEMGGDFAYLGKQYKLEVGGEEFFVDLLLYHRKLKSLVAIELKIGKFKPEYAGKMQFYLSVLNDTKKCEDENPAIGIIICKDKNRTIVEYALKDMNSPMGIANYNLSTKIPEDIQKYMPDTEKLVETMELLENN